MFDSADDPLGISLRERARQQRAQWEAEQAEQRQAGQTLGPTNTGLYGPLGGLQTVMRPMEGRLPPEWDAMFQALSEAGVDELADSSIGDIRDDKFSNPGHLPARKSLFQPTVTDGQGRNDMAGYLDQHRFNPGSLTEGSRALEGLHAYGRNPSRSRSLRPKTSGAPAVSDDDDQAPMPPVTNPTPQAAVPDMPAAPTLKPPMPTGPQGISDWDWWKATNPAAQDYYRGYTQTPAPIRRVGPGSYSNR